MKQNRFPRVSTRGFYDLASGNTITKKPYNIYPKKFFSTLTNTSEITIMIHGLRNNKQGALVKFEIAQKQLRQLGYKHPVVGFSYDSNTKGVQYNSTVLKATNVGKLIAKKNGKNLAKFIVDMKKKFPNLKIRLMGHSLGSEVIIHAITHLNANMVQSAYFFGASVPVDLMRQRKIYHMIEKTIVEKITNYYSPNDNILKIAFEIGLIKKPLGYLGMADPIPKYVQKMVKPENHRFASYAKTLMKFP